MKERQIKLDARLLRRSFRRVILWFYPELAQFNDIDDRWDVLMLVEHSISRRTRIGVNLLSALLMIIGCSVGSYFGLMLSVRALQLRGSHHWLGFGAFIAPIIAGFVLFPAPVMIIYTRRVRRRIREFLRNIDKATCPSCGYSLAGHIDAVDVRCPECGHAIDFTT